MTTAIRSKRPPCARRGGRLGPLQRVLVTLSFLVGFVVFLASVAFGLLARPPEGWLLPEITWRLLFLVAGLAALIFHLFVGFLIGAAFDRMRDTK